MLNANTSYVRLSEYLQLYKVYSNAVYQGVIIYHMALFSYKIPIKCKSSWWKIRSFCKRYNA